MMSETEFDLKIKHIRERAKTELQKADAWRDQERARLFASSGWTEEQIVAFLKKKGKKNA